MEKLEIEGSTVDFFKNNTNGTTIYQFDTSMCEPPHPMVNAMVGLQLLDDNSKLIMINHKPPAGLFPKIENDFDYNTEATDDGKVKIIFTKKSNTQNLTDFTQNSCNG